MNSKYGYLLKDKNVKRWRENLSRGSQITADVYFRRVGNFCETNNLAPHELINKNEKIIYDLLLDAVTEMEKKKFAGSYIVSNLKAVKSWLTFNGIEIKRKIKVRNSQDTPSLRDERVPTQDELKNIFLVADSKTRAMCALIAHSGLRLEVLGNYDGTDGLRIKDLPEMKIDDGISFNKIPTIIRIRLNLSKKRNEYFTFLSEEGCEHMKQYLEIRTRNGEKLTVGSPLITPKAAKKEFITTINIGDAIRKVIRKVGFSWRPYVLRSYFDTQLMVAESKGLIIRDYRSFFMGHKGDIEHTYTLNKWKLPQELIEGMRESYRKAQKYLQTIESDTEGDISKMFKRQLLLVAGFKPEEITKDHIQLNEQEFQKVVREKLVKEMGNGNSKQKVVHTNELDIYLQEGWEFVATLSENRAILKFPVLS